MRPGGHPVCEGLEDGLSLVDCVAGDKDRRFGMSEKLANHDSCVAVRGSGGFRSGRNKIDGIFQSRATLAVLDKKFQGGGELLLGKADSVKFLQRFDSLWRNRMSYKALNDSGGEGWA